MANVFENIREGRYDKYLDRISQEVERRKRIISYSQLQPGRRVRFRSNVRPAYLQGVEATVVGFKNTRILVRLDQKIGRFWGDIRAHATSLEPVDQIDQPRIKLVGGNS